MVWMPVIISLLDPVELVFGSFVVYLFTSATAGRLSSHTKALIRECSNGATELSYHITKTSIWTIVGSIQLPISVQSDAVRVPHSRCINFDSIRTKASDRVAVNLFVVRNGNAARLVEIRNQRGARKVVFSHLFRAGQLPRNATVGISSNLYVKLPIVSKHEAINCVI